MQMATSRNHLLYGLKNVGVITVIFISFLTFLPSNSKSVGIQMSSYSNKQQEMKMVLGSKPPGCVNKCLKCKPCMATLIIPPHDGKKKSTLISSSLSSSLSSSSSSSSHSRGQDNTYYLLSWKCRCGNKLFKP